MKGVIDRIEGDKAVILAEKQSAEFTVEADSLPEGAETDVWLDLEVKGDNIVSAEVDEKMTRIRDRKAREKTERLKEGSETGSKHEKVE